MPRKPTPPPDDPEQFKRFIDMAREVGAEYPAPISSACFGRSRSSLRRSLLSLRVAVLVHPVGEFHDKAANCRKDMLSLFLGIFIGWVHRCIAPGIFDGIERA